jgi:hypothetical protein
MRRDYENSGMDSSRAHCHSFGLQTEEAGGRHRGPEAFVNLDSYCVDATNLSSGAEAYDVSSFVALQGRPGQLLSELLPGCRESDPDTVIKMEFPRLRAYRWRRTRGPPAG